MTPDQLDAFYASRVAAVRNGSEPLRDLRTTDGRNIRAHCALLGNGGRMLTYCDVTDLVRNAQQMEELATIDLDDAPATTGGISGRWPRRNGAGFSATTGRYRC